MNNWKPIETAPKDNPILVYEPKAGNGSIYVCKWDNWRNGWVEASGEVHHMWFPTHWAELPLPPEP